MLNITIPENCCYVVGVNKCKGGDSICLNVLENYNFGDHVGFNTGSAIWLSKDKTPELWKNASYQVGDIIQPLYVGTGEFKKLAYIQLLTGDKKK